MTKPEPSVRNSRVSRKAVLPTVQIQVWAKAAGRCVMCATYLLSDTSFLHTTLVGEIAHNVGATDGSKSPRGESRLSHPERALEPNLLLLCHSCHRRVDSKGLADYYSEQRLASLKAAHESRVRTVTDFATVNRSFALRMGASVRSSFAKASDRQIAEAFRSSGLTHGTEDSRDSLVEIDLPDPETWDSTWVRSKALIAQQVEKVFRDADAARVDTISVFAIGPIPSLVYLGYRLDDKRSVRVFSPSRRNDDSRWMWSAIASAPAVFKIDVTGEDMKKANTVVMSAGLSAPVRRSEIPPELQGLPLVEVTPDGDYDPNILSSSASLDEFGKTWRRAFATLEGKFQNAKIVHVIAAIPAVGAIEIGRAYMRDAQPEAHIYQWSGQTWLDALTLT